MVPSGFSLVNGIEEKGASNWTLLSETWIGTSGLDIACLIVYMNPK